MEDNGNKNENIFWEGTRIFINFGSDRWRETKAWKKDEKIRIGDKP